MARMRSLILACLIAVLLAPMAFAQAIAPKTEAAPRSFTEVCADKSEERGRLRYCDDYFTAALGTSADPVLYLRDRITVLRSQHEAKATESYGSFLTAIYITAFLSIATIVLVLSERKISGISRWAIGTASAALLVMVGAWAAGWLGTYRAEHAAQVELGLLRDQIEVETSQRIASGDKVTMAEVNKWTERLNAIGERFAQSYSSTGAFPRFRRFTNE
ncbi:phenylalanyl-tRNA synthetase subunit alpha [Rhizobiales bacterium]|uniref:phenylalanyl-tRNA synthetase subunit alpha n=1 Tax=Hongsoonwoonella zoysiae TaxID=2821844 RepID=UPI00155FED87|nr:phenylalanyl-tRNA synthetase subunit alpha [Hongsoonwoonella zoysiae]NRG16203.1 phenylalanyl-tRNA synthetase subunit alpha [Hongsoonwoonella zoysiae]